MNNFNQEAYQNFVNGNYQLALELYEQAIQDDPSLLINYKYLGLALLLQNQEEEAQVAWMLPILELEAEEELWLQELNEFLSQEAYQQQQQENLDNAWLIRKYIQEINTEQLDNIIYLLELTVKLDLIEYNNIIIDNLAEIFNSNLIENIDIDLVHQILANILEYNPGSELSIKFTKLCFQYFKNLPIFLNTIFIKTANLIKENILHSKKLVEYIEISLEIQPNNIPLLATASQLYDQILNYERSLYFAERFLEVAKHPLDRIAAIFTLSNVLMDTTSYSERVNELFKKHQEIIQEIIQENTDIELLHLINLPGTFAIYNYLGDTPENNHKNLQEFTKFWQKQLINQFSVKSTFTKSKEKNKTLKIGYLSSCFRNHSVGYLSRWLLFHHDQSKFEIYAYSLEESYDNVQEFIRENSTEFKDLSKQDIPEIFKTIQDDQIDILVDLDSLTSNNICALMGLKPAPIQVTWLGFDASNIPTIDYFIADNYVLPTSAENYYSETIWRLPQTYIAVDGFEVDVPSINRRKLNIPDDAIIYLSAQAAKKRHPENIKLQMKILQKVPNSYFIIKAWNADEKTLKSFFESIASEYGISSDRLRFLPSVASEAEHRANLGIADIVLDTYPYNGATTTLETLWMEIPIVTRVGEQFSARNSYTMMINAGITEGIAWNDEEYIEWGIKLGLDENLRQQVSWKLKQSKQSSPLWNGKQFAREMEKAYLQMWENYLSDF